MVIKQLQKHDFDSGGPSLQREILFNGNDDGEAYIGLGDNTFTITVDTPTYIPIMVSDRVGSTIFQVDEDGSTLINGNLNVNGILNTQPLEGETRVFIRDEENGITRPELQYYHNGEWVSLPFMSKTVIRKVHRLISKTPKKQNKFLNKFLRIFKKK